ncbi:MAG: molybdenum cofactor guanylyltransferase [Flavobacteriaceae bacterium]
MIEKRNITGIILAGGKSSRMGSDKGFINLNSKPFIVHIIEALKPLVNTIIIVSDNMDLEQLIKQFNDDYDMVQLQSENKSMPLIAIYKTHCLHAFESQIKKKEKRLQVAVEKLKNKTINLDPENDQYLKNINTLAQLNEIQHLY